MFHDIVNKGLILWKCTRKR